MCVSFFHVFPVAFFSFFHSLAIHNFVCNVLCVNSYSWRITDQSSGCPPHDLPASLPLYNAIYLSLLRYFRDTKWSQLARRKTLRTNFGAAHNVFGTAFHLHSLSQHFPDPKLIWPTTLLVSDVATPQRRLPLIVELLQRHKMIIISDQKNASHKFWRCS